MSTATTTVTQTVQLAIRATPEQVWNALVDPAVTPAYYIGFRAGFDDLSVGAPYAYTAGGGDVITGRILEVEPGKVLKTTFNGHWDAGVAELPESVVTFAIIEPFMPMPGVTFLSCVHEDLADTEDARHLELGWVTILSGLKTLVETGTPLVWPAA
ncbi:MAG: SRPBCC domain-containing protein [Candidatus Nanopelagicales bacterium]